MKQAAVLVFGDFPQSLAVVRSLGRAGYRVMVASDSQTTVAGHSRYCHARWRYTADHTFAAQLATYLGQHEGICCLFPVGIGHISRVQEAVAEGGITLPVAAVSADLLAACNNKMIANDRARAAGIAVPAARIVTSHQELLAASEQLGYPLIVKTVRSEAPVLGRKAFVVESQQVFDRYFTGWPEAHSQLLVQSYVSGTVCSCDFVAAEGQLVAYYEGSSVRTDMPDGSGFVVEFCGRLPTPALFAAAQAFVSCHNYSGPGLLQCLRCEATGKLYFIEVNPRLSAGIAEAVASGLDVPLLSLQVALGEKLPEVLDSGDIRYKPGIRSYWLERDLVGWMNHWRTIGLQANITWFGHMLRCLLSSHAHINWQWRDPAPSLVILGRFVRRLLSQRPGITQAQRNG